MRPECSKIPLHLPRHPGRVCNKKRIHHSWWLNQSLRGLSQKSQRSPHFLCPLNSRYCTEVWRTSKAWLTTYWLLQWADYHSKNLLEYRVGLTVLLDCLSVCFKAQYIGEWRLIEEGSHFSLKMSKIVDVLKFRNSFSNLGTYCSIYRKVHSNFKLPINHCYFLPIFSKVEPNLRLFLLSNYSIYTIKSFCQGNLTKMWAEMVTKGTGFSYNFPSTFT